MQNALDFLTELTQNNNREWFEAHKEQYEQAKQTQLELVERILDKIVAFEPEYRHLKPAGCTFRIYRDVRFSKDKTPYKTHLGAYFERDGKKSTRAGYYLHIEPNNKSFLAGGMWMPQGEMLKKIRQEIDYNGDKLRNIVQDSTFRKYYGDIHDGEDVFGMPRKLKKAPKDYSPTHPAIELLCLKDFSISHTVTDAQITQADFAEHAAQAWKVLKPLNDFLNTAVEE